jgi:hypothetical protein
VSVDGAAVAEGERLLADALGIADEVAPFEATRPLLESLEISEAVKREASRVFSEVSGLLAAAFADGARVHSESVTLAAQEFVSAVRELADSVTASDELKREKILREVMSLAVGTWSQFNGNRVGAEVVDILARLGLQGGSACTERPYDCKTETGKVRAKFASEVI